MITIIYRLIVLLVLVFVAWVMLDSDELTEQINAMLVIIPLLLRVLMIK